MKTLSGASGQQYGACPDFMDVQDNLALYWWQSPSVGAVSTEVLHLLLLFSRFSADDACTELATRSAVPGRTRPNHH